jgi:hypothetical protein
MAIIAGSSSHLSEVINIRQIFRIGSFASLVDTANLLMLRPHDGINYDDAENDSLAMFDQSLRKVACSTNLKR